MAFVDGLISVFYGNEYLFWRWAVKLDPYCNYGIPGGEWPKPKKWSLASLFKTKNCLGLS